MALISCREASFAYDGNTVLESISFEVNTGDYVCIVGENGSGKSTLIKGLLKLKSPLTGEIVFGDGLKANQIGYLPQQSAHQRDFPASVYEVALSGRLNGLQARPFYSKTDRRFALQKLKEMHIETLKNKSYQELSGGQQQRVLLARALCATEKLLLLDEPVTGLDPVATMELYSRIAEINRVDGITVIMVSHDVRSSLNYATHILHLEKKMLFFGRKGDYLESGIGKRFLGGETACF